MIQKLYRFWIISFQFLISNNEKFPIYNIIYLKKYCIPFYEDICILPYCPIHFNMYILSSRLYSPYESPWELQQRDILYSSHKINRGL